MHDSGYLRCVELILFMVRFLGGDWDICKVFFLLRIVISPQPTQKTMIFTLETTRHVFS